MPATNDYLSSQELAIYQSRLRDESWASEMLRKLAGSVPLPGRIARGLRPL